MEIGEQGGPRAVRATWPAVQRLVAAQRVRAAWLGAAGGVRSLGGVR